MRSRIPNRGNRVDQKSEIGLELLVDGSILRPADNKPANGTSVAIQSGYHHMRLEREGGWSMRSLVYIPVLMIGLATTTRADDIKDLPKDKEFVARVVESTSSEIKLAELADARAANAEVRKFARKMSDEHTKCRKDLLEKAGDLKIAVVTGLSKEHQDAMKRLGELKGAEFDRAYLKNVMERHEKTINLFHGQIKLGTNQKITTFAEKTLPMLQAHLEEASKIQQKIK
jgi:putative membrane protein